MGGNRPLFADVPMAAADARADFSDLKLGPRIPVVWGDSRGLVKRVLFGIARSISTSPYWVEIRDRQPGSEEPGPAELGWIEAGRLFYLGDLFASQSANAPPPVDFPLISFLRDPSGAPVTAAMQLPSTAPLAGVGSDSTAPQRIVAVANVDRVDQFWPETPQAMQAVVRAFLRIGLVPYFSTQKATKRSAAADFVFRVVAPGLSDWKAGKLVCDKAREGSSWSVGDSLPLTRFPSIARALGGKVDHERV